MSIPAIVAICFAAILVLGLVQIILDIKKVAEKINFTNTYLEKLISLFPQQQINDESFSTYTWLTKNLVKMEGLLGRFGATNYRPGGSSTFISNYAILANSLPKYLQGGFDKFDAQFCYNAIVTFSGVIEEQHKSKQKMLVNPVIWFREGIRSILALPITSLYWFGILNETSAYKIKGSAFFTALSSLAALVSFAASIVTIFEGKDALVNIYYWFIGLFSK